MLDERLIALAQRELVNLRRLAVLLNEDPDDAVTVARGLMPRWTVGEACRAVSHWLACGLRLDQIVECLADEEEPREGDAVPKPASI